MKTTFSYTCLGKKLIIEKHDKQNLKFYIKTKQHFAETSENTKEKQLYIIQQETVEISLELIKLQLRFGCDLRTENYDIHALTTQPVQRKLSKAETLATLNAENRCYKISNAADCDYSESAAKSVNTFDDLLFASYNRKKNYPNALLKVTWKSLKVYKKNLY